MPSDQGPWNPGGGPRRPQGGGGNPWGSGGGGPRPVPPDLERMAEEFKDRLRGLLHGGGGGGFGLRAVLVVLVAVVLIWLSTGLYRVQPDEQGLVLRFGAFDRTAPPGLNYHLPWPIEDAIKLPVTRINRVEIGFRSSAADDQSMAPSPDGDVAAPAARDLAEESEMLTGDENIIDINCSVFWRIRDASEFAFQTRNPAITVKAAAESVLRQVIGHTQIESALTEGRAAIEQAVTTGTQAILDQYGTGVEITQIQLQKVDPPAEVIESFRDVQRANTDADRARNEAQAYSNDIVPRARGEAAAIDAAAEGDKAASIATAKGQAARFLDVYAAYSLAKDVTLKRLYIETMQGILTNTPSVIVDDRLRGVLPMLPLGGDAGAAAPVPGAVR